jgi:ribonuclease R
LTYDEVEKALQGKVSANAEPVLHTTIFPLANAYALLRKARDVRGSLNIHSAEHHIMFDTDGHVKDITVRAELKSNQLIEEMMVLANIAVAQALKNRDYPCVYRIHPAPDGTKVQNLKIFTKALNLPSPKSDNPTPHDFNRVLAAVEGGPYESLMNDLILRCQSQAQYNPNNQGHFGLGLADYCHFTSPIRRYADLIVHRLMIDLFDLGEGGYKYTSLDALAEHISTTERQAVAAEREADERFVASYMANHIGDLFDAVIVGVNPSGLFVELRSKHAEAFIPKRLLLAMTHRSSSYFDAALHALRVGHVTYQLGMTLKVKLVEANPITCQVICQPVMEDDKKGRPGNKSAQKSFAKKSKELPSHIDATKAHGEDLKKSSKKRPKK